MSRARTNVAQSRLLKVAPADSKEGYASTASAPTLYPIEAPPILYASTSTAAPYSEAKSGAPKSPRKASPKRTSPKSPRKASPKSPPKCCICYEDAKKSLMDCHHPICGPCHKQVLLTDPHCPQCRAGLPVPEDISRRVALISDCKKEAETQASSLVAFISEHPSARGRDVYSYYTKIYPWIEKACIEARNSMHFDPHTNKQAVYEDSLFRSRAEADLRPALIAKVLQDIGKQLGMDVPTEMKMDFVNSNRAKIDYRISTIDREDRARISRAVADQLRYAPRGDAGDAYREKIFYDNLFLTMWQRSLLPLTL